MGLLRKSEEAATRTDPVASWGERAWKAVYWIFGPSLLSGAALTALGWLFYNPLFGVLIGLAAFALAQAGLTFNAIRKSVAQRGPMAQLGNAVSGNEDDDKDTGHLNEGEPKKALEKESDTSKSPERTPLASGSARYPLLKNDEFLNTYFKGRTIPIARLADEVGQIKRGTTIIDNLTFQDCHIVGTAALVPLDNRPVVGYTLIDCVHDDAEMAFWTGYDRMYVAYIGTIGSENCVFRDCRFTRVGVLVSVAELHAIRGQPGDEQSEPSDEAEVGD